MTEEQAPVAPEPLRQPTLVVVRRPGQCAHLLEAEMGGNVQVGLEGTEDSRACKAQVESVALTECAAMIVRGQRDKIR